MDGASQSEEQQFPDSAIETGAAFLAALFAESDTVLFRPIETWVEAGKKRSRVDYRNTVYRAAVPQLLRFTIQQQLEVAQKERTNLFFGACSRLGNNGRFDQAWQIRTVRVLWADLDGVTVEEAVRRVREAKLPPPSVVVGSGNGVHLYWLLDKPYEIDDAGDPPPVLTRWSEKGGKKCSFRYFVDSNGDEIDVKKKHLCPKLSPRAQNLPNLLTNTHTRARALRARESQGLETVRQVRHREWDPKDDDQGTTFRIRAPWPPLPRMRLPAISRGLHAARLGQ